MLSLFNLATGVQRLFLLGNVGDGDSRGFFRLSYIAVFYFFFVLLWYNFFNYILNSRRKTTYTLIQNENLPSNTEISWYIIWLTLALTHMCTVIPNSHNNPLSLPCGYVLDLYSTWDVDMSSNVFIIASALISGHLTTGLRSPEISAYIWLANFYHGAIERCWMRVLVCVCM